MKLLEIKRVKKKSLYTKYARMQDVILVKKKKSIRYEDVFLLREKFCPSLEVI